MPIRDQAWREGLPWLIGQHVILREPQLADAPALVEALSNADVSRFMTPPPDSVDAFRAFITWVQSARVGGRCVCLAIVTKDGRRAVGLIQLRALEHDFRTAEWGFALAPAHWGTGVFMEGAAMTLDYAFRHLDVHRLEARASVENVRGNGVLAKLGAVREGTLRRSLEQGAGRVDQSLWALLADEWLRGRPVEYTIAPGPASPQAPGGPAAGRPASRPAWCGQLPVLRGRRGSLRQLRPGDAESLLPQLREPEVQRYTFPPPETPDQFEAFLRWSMASQRAGRYACFGIVPSSADLPVGLIQLRAMEPSFQTAEWGFVLGRPYWGTGLFQEMATLVIGFAFDTVGVLRLEARSAVANVRACRVLQRLGAVCEGSLRQSFLMGGTYLDDALYALLADDWRRLRAEQAHAGRSWPLTRSA
jgi:RimJ/RimL family protein N-acetyltransferase